MRASVALLLALTLAFTHPALAGERKFTGAEIKAELTGHVFISETDGRKTEQDFMASGSTMYTDGGNVSQGLWEVRGDQYCSQWPPHEAWACYDVTVDGQTLTFIGSSGRRFPVVRKD